MLLLLLFFVVIAIIVSVDAIALSTGTSDCCCHSGPACSDTHHKAPVWSLTCGFND